MVKGIGTDIVDIDRIRRASLKWSGSFLKKVFTERELSYCNGKNNPWASLAGRFAAKEAIMKALGFGFPYIPFKDIEIVNNSKAPKVMLFGKAKEIAEKQKVSSWLISISHTDSYASAFAIVE